MVGTVPYWGDQVLLCKRNIEPRWGKWTLPAGFMELGETTAQGAARETDEEAGAQIEMEGLITVLSVPRVGQVHLFYRARLLSDVFDPGHETIEARLFTEDEIPWEEIAFRTVKETLVCYFEDRRRGRFERAHTSTSPDARRRRSLRLPACRTSSRCARTARCLRASRLPQSLARHSLPRRRAWSRALVARRSQLRAQAESWQAASHVARHGCSPRAAAPP